MQSRQRPERQGMFEKLDSGTCGECRAGVTVIVMTSQFPFSWVSVSAAEDEQLWGDREETLVRKNARNRVMGSRRAPELSFGQLLRLCLDFPFCKVGMMPSTLRFRAYAALPHFRLVLLSQRVVVVVHAF